MNADLKQAEESKRTALANLRIAKYNTSLIFGSSTNLDRAPGSSDLSSLVSSSLGYESPLGTSASLDVTPLGLGRKYGGLGASLRQALRKGSGLLSGKGLALKSAQSGATVESKQLFITRQATVQSVVEGYCQAVLAREEVKVREQAVTNAETIADGWRKREAEGMAAGIDVSRSDIQVAQSRNSLNTQQRNSRNALDRLMIAIGGGVGETPELTDSVPTVDPGNPALADAIKTALANRGELVIYDERLAEQERQLWSAKDQLRPQLDMVAGFNGSRGSEGFISRSIFNQGVLTAGLEYSIPLDRRITQERSNTASRQLEVLRNLRLFQTDQIVEQVRTAYRRVESARASIDILTKNKAVAEDNINFANLMMEEGVGSSRDVIEAQQALTEADSNLLSAKTDLYLAAIDLKRVMGEDLTTMEFK
jgi:outer membrane protein